MNQQILTNCYFRKKKKYEWYEHDLMTYIENLKHDNFINNMDPHLPNKKNKNFDVFIISVLVTN